MDGRYISQTAMTRCAASDDAVTGERRPHFAANLTYCLVVYYREPPSCTSSSLDDDRLRDLHWLAMRPHDEMTVTLFRQNA